MYSKGFIPLVNKPTRITRETATVIDNIYTNNISNYCNSKVGVLINDNSDHLAILVICKATVNR